jgi:hypothetical protein
VVVVAALLLLPKINNKLKNSKIFFIALFTLTTNSI